MPDEAKSRKASFGPEFHLGYDQLPGSYVREIEPECRIRQLFRNKDTRFALRSSINEKRMHNTDTRKR